MSATGRDFLIPWARLHSAASEKKHKQVVNGWVASFAPEGHVVQQEILVLACSPSVLHFQNEESNITILVQCQPDLH